MKTFSHYLIMWLVFSFLFTMAVVGLELLEGSKITSSQYYGLRNLGGMLILLSLLLCMALYPLLFLPLTLLAHRWIRLFPIQLLIYGGIGGTCGIWVFNMLYNDPPGHAFIEAYDLNIANAIILFILVGLFYGLVDHSIGKRKR